jgi:hypothetical protein
MNPWNNRFRTHVEQNYDAYKLVMMWLVKKFREKFKDFNMRWNTNWKKWRKSQQVKILNMKKNYIEKISMHFTIKLLMLWWHIFFIKFDITMTYFLSPQFSFFMCDKHNVIISKVHNESILFLKLIDNFL